TLAAAEAEEHREHVADDGEHAADGGGPGAGQQLAAGDRQRDGRHQPDGGHALADVDDEDPEGEDLALGAQGIGAAGVAGALFADIHPAVNPPYQEPPHEGTEQIGQEAADTEGEHGSLRMGGQGAILAARFTAVRAALGPAGQGLLITVPLRGNAPSGATPRNLAACRWSGLMNGVLG